MGAALCAVSVAGRAADDEPDELTTLAAYNVKADRIEDFGFRVRGIVHLWGSSFPYVAAVLPNTAAAKTGLRPGDRILKSDGKSAAVSFLSLGKWHKLQQRKWAEVESGRLSVSWTLDIEDSDTKQVRTVKLVVPTPPPHWGASKWKPPEGRAPAVVSEAGPLDGLCRTIFEHGVWSLLSPHTADALALEPERERRYRGYQWSIVSGKTLHRLFVSQQNGRTEIVLERKVPGSRMSYLTSPAAALQKAYNLELSLKSGEVPLENARRGFEEELDFWLTKVGQVSERWPLELIPGVSDLSANVAAIAPPSRPSAAFSSLPVATEAQRALLGDALGKIGVDADRWAYTESIRAIDDKRVYTVRVDPSKPEEERCTLLKINGKPPKPGDVQRWRDEGRDVSAPLGELPPLSRFAVTEDAHVFSDDIAAVVFEIPIREGGAEFAADRFQLLVRVNKAWRGLEEIALKLRESVRVTTGVKIVDGGFSARFQSFAADSVPQPVALKAGGAGRIFLVKLSRTFEATRTDFARVEPHRDVSPL